MSIPAAIVLGLIVGWLIEWGIDWWYWRRKFRQLETENGQLAQRAETAEKNAAEQTASIGRLQQEISDLKAEIARYKSSVKDDLKLIKGIGPDIEHRLNLAGVVTFAQLAEQTPESLEGILGDVVKRLANESALIEQARQLASKNGQPG